MVNTRSKVERTKSDPDISHVAESTKHNDRSQTLDANLSAMANLHNSAILNPIGSRPLDNGSTPIDGDLTNLQDNATLRLHGDSSTHDNGSGTQTPTLDLVLTKFTSLIEGLSERMSKFESEVKKVKSQSHLISHLQSHRDSDSGDDTMSIVSSHSGYKTPMVNIPASTHLNGLAHASHLNSFSPMVINQIDPGTFGGDHSKAAEWLHNFDNVMSVNSYSSQQKLIRVSAYLTGSAAAWFRSEQFMRKFKDWADFKDRFFRCFCGSSSGMTLRKLVNNQQGHSEHVSTYFSRTVDMCAKFKKNMSQEEIIEFLVNGLQPSVLKSLVASKRRHKWTLEWLAETFYAYPRENSQNQSHQSIQGSTLNSNKRSQKPRSQRSLENWTCANCETKGHDIDTCPNPIDKERVSANKKKYTERKMSYSKPVDNNSDRKDSTSQNKSHSSSNRSVNSVTNSHLISDIPLPADSIENPLLTIHVNGVEVRGQVDSGSHLSIIPQSFVKRLKLTVLPWEHGDSIAYNNTTIKFHGMAPVYVVHKSLKAANSLTMAIGADKDSPIPFWGRDLLNALKLTVGFDGHGKAVIQSLNVKADSLNSRAIQAIKPEQLVTDLLEEVGPLYHDNKELCDNMFRTFGNVFSQSPTDIGRTNSITHKIDLTSEKPTFKPPYSVPVRYKEELKKTINKQLDMGVIRPSQSSYAAPVFFVKKDHGADVRLVADYRELNKITIPDKYPMPRPDDVVGLLAGMKVFAKLDITAMFNQIPIDEKDIHKTAIITPSGLYECPVMPFGLMNAPATAVRLMRNVLRGLDQEICSVYFDDIIVFATGIQDLVQRCAAVLSRLRAHNLKLKPSKCKFATESVVFLGFKISARGSEIDPARIEAVKNFAVPKNATEVRSFHGMANFNRQYIKDFAKIAAPFGPIMGNKPFVWSPECQKAFETLKEALASAPIVVHFDPSAQHELRTDASNVAIGAVLFQKHPTDPNLTGVVHYFSKTLNKDQRKYSATKRELYAAYASIKELNHYLYGGHFTLVTDHQALSLLRSKKDPHNNFARWTAELQEYDFNVVYKKGELHCDADCLSRLIDVEENDNLNVEPWFPPETVRSINAITSSARDQAEDDTNSEDLIYNVRAGQREDAFCSKYLDILESDLNDTVKARKAHNFTIQDGVLYRVCGNTFLTVVPELHQNAVLISCHDTSGHLGFSRTYGLAKERFYWTKMRRDIKKYVKTCAACQLRKAPNTRQQGFTQPLPIAEDVFNTLGMDLLVKLPKSSDNYNTILVVTDNLSKYVITMPLRNERSDTIIYAFFNQVIAKYGCPKLVITDCGHNLISERANYFFKMFGIKRRTTSPYRPQSNGQTERFNRTLAASLSTYVDRNQKDWPDYLQAVTFAYNITEHSVTRVSPFELVFGRKPRIPLDNIMERCEFINPHRPIDGSFSNTRIAHIKRLIKVNQLANKKRIDKDRSQVKLKVGDFVILARPTRSRGDVGKLSNTYVGPFKITERVSDLNFEICDLVDTWKTMVVHVAHLRKYSPRPNLITDNLVDPQFIPKDSLTIDDDSPEAEFPLAPIMPDEIQVAEEALDDGQLPIDQENDVQLDTAPLEFDQDNLSIDQTAPSRNDDDIGCLDLRLRANIAAINPH